MSKVLHTTTNNWFRQFEGYFSFLKLLAAGNGISFVFLIIFCSGLTSVVSLAPDLPVLEVSQI